MAGLLFSLHRPGNHQRAWPGIWRDLPPAVIPRRRDGD